MSQELSRQSRRAQNDVLATVGVLSGPDQRYKRHHGSLPIAAADKAIYEGLVSEPMHEKSSGEFVKACIIYSYFWLQERAPCLRNGMQVGRFPAAFFWSPLNRLVGVLFLFYFAVPGDSQD